VDAAEERRLQLADVDEFHSLGGKGITGKVGGHEIALGTRAWMRESGVEDRELPVGDSGDGTAVYVAIDHQYAGVIYVADPVKALAADAVRALKSAGLRVVMLTGDNRSVSEIISKRLGIQEFKAEVLPGEKAAVVRELQQEGRRVAMAGDGINDAPALAQANVGIAMSTGADVAIESAGITLLKGDLAGIVRARKLSRAVMKNIRQNLFFAFLYNSLGVPIAAGVLYPFFGLLLSPILAAAAMSFSSVSVITNSLRLRKVKL
jgi:Cu+-exporting ATPase